MHLSRNLSWTSLLLILSCSPFVDLGTTQAAASNACTPGLDQTCNEELSVSALWGQCQQDGTCVCHLGFDLQPTSGRCAPAPLDAGQAPQGPALDGGPVSSHDGGAIGCDPLLQDCADPAHGCYQIVGDDFECAPAGNTADGDPCVTASECLKGSQCRGVCTRACSLDGGAPGCGVNQTCEAAWAAAYMPGGCLP